LERIQEVLELKEEQIGEAPANEETEEKLSKKRKKTINEPSELSGGEKENTEKTPLVPRIPTKNPPFPADDSVIKFENVYLGYSSKQREGNIFALENINFSIKKSQKVAFIGR